MTVLISNKPMEVFVASSICVRIRHTSTRDWEELPGLFQRL